ncbi:PREDICTED: uncharacterized protein LOC109150403 [Ipomoea nil]|uniref:uncharacterized protein LOC109150403 n=1 Tax=Ipomoea nil TaxID=35883 RepID=UPI000900E097|nr:PREDICTED: uncharacterized protein LOC109150403 [Ipomoea nil]
MAHPMEASPKWKTFLWRAISDILPIINNLLIKRVDVFPMCAMCGIRQEDTMHSLVSCGYASSIWAQSNLLLPNIVTNIFHEWFSAILNVLDTDGIIYGAAILYHIWRARNRRNRMVWDACLPLPMKLVAVAATTMHAWRRVHCTFADRNAADNTAATATAGPSLSPLPEHAATMDTAGIRPRKCYVDVGYYHAMNSATVGAVLLDADRGYIAAYSVPLQSCFSQLMADAFACKEALSWLRARGEHAIQLYTDCHTLQCYLSSPGAPPRSYIGYAIYGCKACMSTFNFS